MKKEFRFSNSSLRSRKIGTSTDLYVSGRIQNVSTPQDVRSQWLHGVTHLLFPVQPFSSKACTLILLKHQYKILSYVSHKCSYIYSYAQASSFFPFGSEPALFQYHKNWLYTTTCCSS